MTYAELDAITAKLAAFIRHKNIGADDFVSVLIPRNEFMAITAWGVVRALYRLGFAWPITGADYLDNMVEMLDDKAFF